MNLKFNLGLKRIWDIGFSLLGLGLSLPLWIIIALAIYLEGGGPAFFSDTRIGKNKKPYRHFKFRSMVNGAEDATGPTWSKNDDIRVTQVGRFLRATALDELPQLLNIIKGDMSFVGPRPERKCFVERFLKEIANYEKRFSVKPGLTGMAQVYGKYDTPAQKKLEYDLEYIKRMNLFLDLKLIILSFLITLKGGWLRFEKRGIIR